jgi:hypothetical protein
VACSNCASRCWRFVEGEIFGVAAGGGGAWIPFGGTFGVFHGQVKKREPNALPLKNQSSQLTQQKNDEGRGPYLAIWGGIDAAITYRLYLGVAASVFWFTSAKKNAE